MVQATSVAPTWAISICVVAGNIVWVGSVQSKRVKSVIIERAAMSGMVRLVCELWHLAWLRAITAIATANSLA